MNLSKLLTREELIAGLDIKDGELNFVYLDYDRKTRKISVKTLANIPLPRGIIVDGIITHKEDFIQALRQIAKTAKGVKYVIASIPPDKAYYKIFSFPKSVSQEKLDEAMKLAVDFQLPFAKKDIYYDWEKISGDENQESEIRVPFVAIRKDIIDAYIDCINKSGMKAVAIEIHPFSLTRTAAIDDTAYLVTQKNNSGFIFFTLKQKTVDFIRAVPRSRITDEGIADEETRILNYHQAKNDPIAQKIAFENITIEPLLLHNDEIRKNASQWSVALGAALRAKLPRKEDDLISIMPIGTEKAYEYQRAASFLSFMTNTTVGLALFFSISYISAFFLMTSLQENFNQIISNLSSVSVPADSGEIEKNAKSFNALVGKTGAIVRTFPRWSVFLEEFFGKIPQEIVLRNLSIPAASGQIGITGTAKTRAALNNFRTFLQEWPLIANVSFPITNLEAKEDIPFQVAFILRNPQELYNWK